MVQSTSVAEALYRALCKDLDNSSSLVSIGFPTAHQRSFAIQVMRDKFLSKFVPRGDPTLDAVALQSFAHANDRCKDWRPDCTDLNSWQQQTLGTFLKYFSDFFENDYGPDCEFSWGNISLHAKCGPGVSHGSKGTSFFEKMYSSTLTASSPYISDLYQADIKLWAEETIAEQIRLESYGPISLIRGSKFTFVPKTAKTSRMIAIEPTLNMFYQLGIGGIIEKRLKRHFGISLHDQPDINRCLAALGSRIDSSFGDGFATIDLTSASDSLSLSLAGYSIPSDTLDKLLALRSPYGIVSSKDDHLSTVKLHMLSTMGNGYTFPLQTALFASIAAACVSQDDDILIMPKAWSEYNVGGLYSVFGDDIIVKSRSYSRTQWLLRFLGFEPNPEKCFASGEFRESCGFDFYQGFNVRPFFLRRADTLQDLTVAFNGVVEWAARCIVPIPSFLRCIGSYLDSAGGAFYVPMGEDSTAGIRVPYSLIQGLKRDPDTQSVAYACFVPRAEYLRFKDGGKPYKRQGKPLLHSNPSGLLMSVLRGECRSGRISVRSSKLEYGTKWRIAPNWDYRPYTLQEWFDDYSCNIASLPRRTALILEGNLPRMRRIRRYFK